MFFSDAKMCKAISKVFLLYVRHCYVPRPCFVSFRLDVANTYQFQIMKLADTSTFRNTSSLKRKFWIIFRKKIYRLKRKRILANDVTFVIRKKLKKRQLGNVKCSKHRYIFFCFQVYPYLANPSNNKYLFG